MSPRSDANATPQAGYLSALLDQERELFELNGQIDRNQCDAGGKAEDNRGKVKDAADACRNERIGHSLCRLGWDSDNTQFRAGGRNHQAHRLGGLDSETVHERADLARVRIEEGDDAKAALLESAVAQQRPGQIAHAGHGDEPVAVDAKNTTNGGDQFAHGIADAGLAKVSEVSEILADLCVRDTKEFAQLATGNLLDPLAQKEFESAQVKTQSANAGPRWSCLVSLACAHGPTSDDGLGSTSKQITLRHCMRVDCRFPTSEQTTIGMRKRNENTPFTPDSLR